MKITDSCIVIAASALAMLLAPQSDLAANARGSVSATHPAPSRLHWVHRHDYGARHRRDFAQWPYYGGLMSTTLSDAREAVNYPPGPLVINVPEQQLALSCQSSTQVVTVPAKNGGTAEITIRRC